MFKLWLPTILTLATTVVSALTPQIQAAISHHPLLTTIGAAVLGILSHLWPSPVAQATK